MTLRQCMQCLSVYTAAKEGSLCGLCRARNERREAERAVEDVEADLRARGVLAASQEPETL